MKRKSRKRRKKSSSMLSVLKTGLFLLLVLFITYVLVTYVVRKSVVHNVSMQDTLYDGDNILVDQLSYRLDAPKRYDIICFKNYENKELLIKRIIGLPGEKVKILAGVIYINDNEIKDINNTVEKAEIDNPGLAGSEIILGEDEYFVLGDNRAESIDSRYPEIGNIKRKDIIGKASVIIYPFNRIRRIK